jgi:hypothetical protein
MSTTYIEEKKPISGGPLSGTLRQFSIPVEPSHETKHDDKVTVKLVSPVQQTIDQTKDEVERENMKQGIKRKRSQQSVSPTTQSEEDLKESKSEEIEENGQEDL